MPSSSLDVQQSIADTKPSHPFDPSKPKFSGPLTFGTGAHQCLGHHHAMVTLTMFVAVLAAEYTIVPEEAYRTDAYRYLPMLFPKHSRFRLEATAW